MAKPKITKVVVRVIIEDHLTGYEHEEFSLAVRVEPFSPEEAKHAAHIAISKALTNLAEQAREHAAQRHYIPT